MTGVQTCALPIWLITRTSVQAASAGWKYGGLSALTPKRVSDMVLDAMTDHEKLSMEVLGDEQTQRGRAVDIANARWIKTVSQKV